MEVRRVDDVHVDDAERSHPCRREVQRGRRPEPARAQEEHLALEQLLLARFADFRQQDVPSVTGALFGRERGRRDPRPPFVLPATEAAGHRHDVGVAELLQRVGSEGGAVAAGAEHHDRRILFRQLRLDLGLEVPARDEDRAGDGALVVLVLFAHVEEPCRLELGLGFLG